MSSALSPAFKKRTYWQDKDDVPFVLETSTETMVKLAQSYNKNGDRFPQTPRIDIDILDINQRVASVKLTADEWIDYMHIVKNDQGEWKIINVLWQYHDTSRHVSHK